MFVIDTLRLNKFEEHSIPTPQELFSRFGYTKKEGTYSGDAVIKEDQSKVEQIAEVEKTVIEED